MQASIVNKPLAIVCADIHLSMKPPTARSGEKCWFKSMWRPLNQIKQLREHWGIPVLIAGDLFDRWNSPPELVTFAMRCLTAGVQFGVYAIAGQHDLPYHAEADLHKSALGILVEAGCVTLVPPEGLCVLRSPFQNVRVHGFGWNVPVQPLVGDKTKTVISVCLHHAYRFDRSANAYTNAPLTGLVSPAEYSGYDFLITGDNHISWQYELNSGTKCWNPGSLMRRTTDQAAHRPRVGLLYADRIESVYLDTSGESFNASAVEVVSPANPMLSLTEFMTKLQELKSTAIDFGESIMRYLDDNEVSPEAKKYVMEALEHGRKNIQ